MKNTLSLGSTAPVGVFDSGVGGISVLKHIRAALPAEDLLYVADSYHAPYGNKSPDFILRRSIALTDFLIEQGAKAIVVACNTATAAAVDKLREKYRVPIIGMEPAIKTAAAATKKGIVGVLATVGTLKSAQFAALLESYGRNVQVETQACIGLVECIERGELTNDATRALLLGYLTPLLAAGADAIVLGCTHYPFVRPLIEQIVGDQVRLIDTGAAVAKQLQKRLAAANLLKCPVVIEGEDNIGTVKFWTNSQAENARDVMEKLWGSALKVSLLPHSGSVHVAT